MDVTSPVFFVVALMAGRVQGTFSIIIPMICVNFSLPFSKEIEKKVGVSTKRIRGNVYTTLVFWVVVNTAALAALCYFLPMYLVAAYAIGSALTIFKMKQTGLNKINIIDYCDTYKGFFTESEKKKISAYLDKKGYLK